MASTSKKAHKLDGSDGIFQLPEEILQRIFFFLPVEDAITLSASSKTWQNLWTSLPVLKLSFDHDENVPLDDFVASIEKSLSTLRSRSAIIESFSLTMNPPQKEGSNNFESHLHDWLSLIMKNYVKEVDLRVSDSPDNIFYTLPQSLFTSKTLLKLQLIGCKFPTNISFSGEKSRLHEFLCVREITLEDVIARDDQIQELVNLSRNFLEKLTIKTSPPIEHLILRVFSQLNFIEVNVKSLRVRQAMNLETMVLYGIHRVNAYGARNIKTLKCLTWHTWAYHWIRALISTLPLVETIQLYMVRNEMIEILSDSLKTLFLCQGPTFEEPLKVEVDAPRLSRIFFTGFSFPEIKIPRSRSKVDLHHFGHPSGGVHSSQLFRLGRFSQNAMYTLLEIHLHRIFMENLLTLEELKEHPVVHHPTNVNMISLQCIPAASNYSSFLDALFWTCHPSRLLVLINNEETLNSPHKASFIRYLVDELVDRENNPECCLEDDGPKCWRHYIADVRFQLYKSTHEFEAHELTEMPVEMAENGAFDLVETCRTKGIAAQFRLLWLPYPV